MFTSFWGLRLIIYYKYVSIYPNLVRYKSKLNGKVDLGPNIAGLQPAQVEHTGEVKGTSFIEGPTQSFLEQCNCQAMRHFSPNSLPMCLIRQTKVTGAQEL